MELTFSPQKQNALFYLRRMEPGHDRGVPSGGSALHLFLLIAYLPHILEFLVVNPPTAISSLVWPLSETLSRLWGNDSRLAILAAQSREKKLEIMSPKGAPLPLIPSLPPQ